MKRATFVNGKDISPILTLSIDAYMQKWDSTDRCIGNYWTR